MPDRSLERHECAETISDQGSFPIRRKCFDQACDTIGGFVKTFQARGRSAKTWKIGDDHSIMRSERGHYPIETFTVGQQRMKQDQRLSATGHVKVHFLVHPKSTNASVLIFHKSHFRVLQILIFQV
jgi:hypothetical protein